MPAGRLSECHCPRPAFSSPGRCTPSLRDSGKPHRLRQAGRLVEQLSQRFACQELACRQASRRRPRRFACKAENQNGSIRPDCVSVVLLAGGSGKRMKAAKPKQYLELGGQPIAIYSLHTFASMPEVFELVIVCNFEYRELFLQYYDLLPRQPALTFAEPGNERQDSVYNGFQAVNRRRAELVAIHDSARPLITQDDTRHCIQDALHVGAAVLGVPVKPTIKQVSGSGNVERTLHRANLWEVQTPQVIKPDLLEQGFALVRREKLEVTDDVSIVEALGEAVKVTKGSYTNLKVTTPEDMIVAEGFLRERQEAVDVAVLKKVESTDLESAAA